MQFPTFLVILKFTDTMKLICTTSNGEKYFVPINGLEVSGYTWLLICTADINLLRDCRSSVRSLRVNYAHSHLKLKPLGYQFLALTAEIAVILIIVVAYLVRREVD